MASYISPITSWVLRTSSRAVNTANTYAGRCRNRALKALSSRLTDDEIDKHFLTRRVPSDKLRQLTAPTSSAIDVDKEITTQSISQDKVESIESGIKALETSHKSQKEALTKLKEAALSDVVEHPIYGELLMDFGYKKLYATDAEALVDRQRVPIWEKQRVFRQERADKIANDKIKNNRFGFPGVVSMFELSKDEGESQKNGIIDGQHRAEAIKVLKEKGNLPKDFKVLVEVFPVGSSTEVSQLFTEINQAEPVKLVDMPDAASIDHKKILDGGVKTLEKQFKEMFRSTSRCRRPHIHADTLRDELFQANVIERCNIKTEEDLVKWILKKNEELAARPDTSFESTGKKGSDSVLKKARQHNFYLGMSWSWLYE